MQGAEETNGDRHSLEQADKVEAMEVPSDHDWPKRVIDPELREAFWRDPDPANTAVLTADLIREYHYEVGRMIRPFQEKHLNSASYDLTLGPRCLVDGEEVILGERDQVLRIEPGSIALAPSREMLFIPHWLVATFNLKSRYIFKGLLMGIGPQIDPGYMGVLTCPLHNISCEPIDLHFCEPFAKLDFIRTSWGATVDLTGVDSEDSLYKRAERGELVGYKGNRMTLWPREENFRPPLVTGKKPAGVKGFLGGLKEQVEEFGTKLSWGFGGGLILAITAIAAVVGVGALAVIYTDGRVGDARDDAVRAARVELKSEIQELDHARQVSGGGRRQRPFAAPLAAGRTVR